MTQLEPKIIKACSTWYDDPTFNEYNSIEGAVDAVPDWGEYIIKLYSDFANIRELNIRNNKKIQIDGQNAYGIIFREGEPIATPQDGCLLKFNDITHLRGDAIIIRYDCNICLYNCETVITRILAIGGKYSNIYLSNNNTKQMHDSLASLVNQMLQTQKDYKKIKSETDKYLYEQRISLLDNKIDELVYKLYNLTDDEINIIEEK